MNRFEIAHVPATGRVNGRPLSSKPEQWDVVDTTTGEVIFEARSLYGKSGAERAEEARREWEAQPEPIALVIPGTPGWDE
jgi:hypothetical protein